MHSKDSHYCLGNVGLLWLSPQCSGLCIKPDFTIENCHRFSTMVNSPLSKPGGRNHHCVLFQAALWRHWWKQCRIQGAGWNTNRLCPIPMNQDQLTWTNHLQVLSITELFAACSEYWKRGFDNRGTLISLPLVVWWWSTSSEIVNYEGHSQPSLRGSEGKLERYMHSIACFITSCCVIRNRCWPPHRFRSIGYICLKFWSLLHCSIGVWKYKAIPRSYYMLWCTVADSMGYSKIYHWWLHHVSKLAIPFRSLVAAKKSHLLIP